MSWPVALLAVSMPTTRPRRSTNQRVATSRQARARPFRCRGRRRRLEERELPGLAHPSEASMPHATSVAVTTTARTPKRLMNAAANGAIRPKSVRRTARPNEMSAALQPNSFSTAREDARRALRPGGRQHGEKGRSRDNPAIMQIARRHRRSERVGKRERGGAPLRGRDRAPPGRRRSSHRDLLFMGIDPQLATDVKRRAPERAAASPLPRRASSRSGAARCSRAAPRAAALRRRPPSG